MDGAVPLIALALIGGFVIVCGGLVYGTVVMLSSGRKLRSLVRARRWAVAAVALLIPLFFLALLSARTVIGPAPSVVALLGAGWGSMVVLRLTALIRESAS